MKKVTFNKPAILTIDATGGSSVFVNTPEVLDMILRNPQVYTQVMQFDAGEQLDAMAVEQSTVSVKLLDTVFFLPVDLVTVAPFRKILNKTPLLLSVRNTIGSPSYYTSAVSNIDGESKKFDEQAPTPLHSWEIPVGTSLEFERIDGTVGGVWFKYKNYSFYCHPIDSKFVEDTADARHAMEEIFFLEEGIKQTRKQITELNKRMNYVK